MEKDFPIFRNYLEEEDDKPYFTVNSLAYYYEDMERKQKLITDMSKLILGYDNKLNVNLEEMEKRIAAELGKWDGKVEELPETVNGLLTAWVEDGTLSSVIDSTIVEEKLAPLTAQLAEADTQLEMIKKERVSVLDYGAKGDGSDDTSAILAAYNACAAGGILEFPLPSVKYLMKQTFIIDKPIRIRGAKGLHEFGNGLERANIIEFSKEVKTGFRNDSYNVTIEGVTIVMTSITSDTYAAIHLNGDDTGRSRQNTIKDVYIVHSHLYGAGVRGSGVLVTYLNNVHTWQGEYGFIFDGALNTSINFQNTWARHASITGYHLDNCIYTSFINTTSDSLQKPEHGYVLKKCSGISFLGGAAEHVTKSYIKLDNSKDVTFNGFVGVFGNSNGTGISNASFAQLVNGTKQVTFIGCHDYDAHLMNSNSIYVDATSFAPISVNCDFRTGINNNGTVVLPLDPTLLYSKMNIGMTTITDNPKGTGAMVSEGRHLATVNKRLGVLNADLSGWRAYIESNGTLYMNDSGTLPEPSATYRGIMRWKTMGTGIEDEWYICVKKSDETYAWKKINLI